MKTLKKLLWLAVMPFQVLGALGWLAVMDVGSAVSTRVWLTALPFAVLLSPFWIPFMLVVLAVDMVRRARG